MGFSNALKYVVLARYIIVNMNHQKVYNELISKAKFRELNTYTEKHHILPKCMGGNNDIDNLVNLTAREHFIAHLLLVHIYPNNQKLKIALWAMTNGWTSKFNNRNHLISSRMYEFAKVEAVKAIGDSMRGIRKTDEHINNMKGPRPHTAGINNHYYGKGQFGKDNPMYKKRVIDIWIEKYGYEEAHAKMKDTIEKTAIKISNALKGRTFTEEHKKHISESRKAYFNNMSEEEYLEYCKSKKDTINVYQRTDEHKEFMRQKIKAVSKQIHRIEKCVVCGKEMNVANITRWHNKNCKNNQ